MKTKNVFVSGVCALAIAFLAGCSSTPPAPPRPVVVYPVTYDVPVGNTQVTSVSGPQNLNVSATQQVTAEVGEPLYYQIASPVAVTVAIYERRSSSYDRVLLKDFQGMNFTSSFTPAVPNLEFVFSVVQANSSGTLKFTLSDRPIAPAVSSQN